MEWVFTPDEFSYIWQTETGLDRRPHPIDLAPRATAATESARSALALEHRFPPNGDPDLTGTLRFLARTDVTRVTVFGDDFDGTGNRGDPVLAVAVGFGNWGALVRARNGEITLIACHARTVGKHLVATLGTARAGRLPAMREPRATVLCPEQGPGAPGPAEIRARRLREALHRPIDARGFFTITIAPENPMSPPPIHRTWLDFTGDGRYLLAAGADLSLTPVGDAGLAAELTRLARLR
ncbi:ESX secretion-associated protein EspG [Nocardia carnea]|uniref:ESX secretion-associated protein EspG n=1 Tax=Nocardia carnea TaxID=37328 RepID=UPI00245389D8|nr:ESX secretion-associated protein EspG [Nocardia carnea]